MSKWTLKNWLALAAYLAVFGTLTAEAMAGAQLNVTLLVSAGVGLAVHLFGFFQSPPGSVAQAVAQAETDAGAKVISGAGKALLFVGAVGLGVSAQEGCGWFQQNSPAVVTDLSQLAACALPLVLGGGGASMVIAQCGPTTIGDVESVIASLIAYYTMPQDGGVGAAPPPFPNAPKSLTPEQLAILHGFVAGLH